MGPHTSSPSRSEMVRSWLERRAPGAGVTEIPRAGRARPLRASSGQRRLWFQDQTDEIGGDRNLPFAWRLTGRLSASALFAALDNVVARHESLRTVFRPEGSDLFQTVAAPYRFDRQVVDLTHRAEDVDAEVAAFAYHAFDLSEGVLLRARLYRVADEEHILVLAVPHLVVDDWSMRVLLDEIAVGYAALVAGREPDLPELTVQYPDFAEWQRTRLDAGDMRTSLDYWRGRLDGVPTVLQLPTDRQRPPRSTHRSGWVSFELDADIARLVERLSSAERATPFMVLLAAYGALLSRWSGADDFLVGCPVAGREHPSLAPLIGFFVNTLPMRVTVDPRATFRSLLRDVRETAVSAMEHQDVPFDHLVQTLAPERSSATNPLVQVALAMNAPQRESLRLPGVAVEDYPVAGRSSRYDLTMSLQPRGEAVHGELIYDSDLFDATTADGFFESYLDTVRALATEPDVPMPRVQPVPARTPSGSAGAVARYDRSTGLAARIEASARSIPTRPAIVSGHGSFTFDELDRYASSVAARLTDLGVGTGTTVGVELKRTHHSVGALLGVWKAGAAFVPLHRALPADDVATIAREATIDALVAEADSPFAREGLRLVDPTAISPAAHAQTAPPRHPDAVACILYGLDRDGRPAPVEITHGNIAHAVATLTWLAPAADALVGNLMTPCHHAWLWSTLVPLAHGSAVVVAETLEGLNDGAPGPVDLVVTTPSLLAAQRMPPSGQGPRTVVVTGEVCSPSLSARWSAGRRFVNAYSVGSTGMYAARADTARGDDPTSLGRPEPNVELRVLDRYLRPVPVGGRGELFVSGPACGQGGPAGAALAAARFVPDPFDEGARPHPTGDIVRVRPDGALDFVHRARDGVFVRGFETDPSQIERVAATASGVAASAVFPIPGPPGKATLGLAVVRDSDCVGEPLATLRQTLEHGLPDYLVPARILQLDSIPTTPAGTKDVAALALMCARTPTGDVLWTPSEIMVAAIWSELLRCPVRRVEDNFFELGGHSLLASQVVLALRKKTGVRISIRKLFALPTVGAFAAELDQLLAVTAGRKPGDLPPTPTPQT